MATGENKEMRYGTLRLLSVQPFVGISDELLQELDEKLKKIRVSSPDDDDEPSDDEQRDDPPTDRSWLLKLKLSIFGLILLF